MIFEIEKDWYCDREVVYSSLSELKNLHWSSTVQLTLTIQFPFEMIFILETNAIPFLEHLYITVEQEQLRINPYLDAPPPQIQFCESDIRQMTDGTRLQTLVLRHLALYNVIILIRSFNMPLLNKLTLVDIFDETLMHCEEFCQIINHKHLPCLKEFYFLIYFPGHLYEAFEKIIVNIYDVTCFFNNLAYHLDEQVVSINCFENVTKSVLLFYTSPLDVLLQYTRTIHNHSFAQYSTQINRRSIKWICNKIDSLNQLTTTFNKLASGHLNTLYLEFYKTKTFIQTNESNSSWPHLWFPWLRSVIFAFAHDSIVRSERVYIIDHILHISPRLSHLTVEWNDLHSCSQSNTNVKHVHLRLYKRYSDPNPYIDINHLFQLLPNICCLETSDGNIALNQNLIRFIVKIVDTFHQLVQLTINKRGLLPLQPETEVTITKAIFNTGNKRLMNSNICQIIFPIRNELRIWLS
ncbi:unnamed protein product [Rotaria sordida]|uniref:Uncharacterized protein n=1 Tax=Rotaria sordida TaxID=392033 RepID=A0A819EQW6_9BILA|nr:unnamed protein product [Rotaria sordida]